MPKEQPIIVTPIIVELAKKDGPSFLIGGDAELILSTYDAKPGELQALADAFNNQAAAKLFFNELLDSVETLTGIAEERGPRTLADLMYLHSAIMHGGFIDHYPDESAVLEIAAALEHGELWTKFIKTEYMLSPVKVG